MDFTTSTQHSTIFFSYPTEVGQAPLAREDSLTVFLSNLNGSDAATEGSGSQESQVSAGGLERRLAEEAASFAAMEVELDRPSSHVRTATRKSTTSSESQVDSQNSQSGSSQDVLMTDSPPRSLIRLWSPPLQLPGENKKPTDERMLLLSHQEAISIASSSRAVSRSSDKRYSRKDNANSDDSDHEGGPVSRPDYTRRNEKKRRPVQNTALDTRGRHRRGKSEHQCPVCQKFFADDNSLSRHRSAFKMHPACLDLDAAPLTVYRCRVDECAYRDHRRDNVLNHEATHHPGEHNRNNVVTITYDRADLEALIKADQQRASRR